MKTKAIVFREANVPKLEELELPKLRPTELRVRTEFSGVSIGTESTIFSGIRTHNGTFPLVGGYMSCGIIQEVGSKVDDFTVGDRIIGTVSRLNGEVNSVFGGHMSQCVLESAEVTRIPQSIPSCDAAMYTMPCIGLNAVSMVAMNENDSVLIQGQGLVGQFFGQFARNLGAKIIAIEPDPIRSKLSRQYVTEHVLNPEKDDVKAAVEQITDGTGPSVVVEATGLKKLIGVAAQFLRFQSKMVFLAWYPNDISLEYHRFHANKISAYFPMGGGGKEVLRAVLDNMARKTINVGGYITDTIPFDKACAAYQRIIEGDRSIMGMVIDWRNA